MAACTDGTLQDTALLESSDNSLISSASSPFFCKDIKPKQAKLSWVTLKICVISFPCHFCLTCMYVLHQPPAIHRQIKFQFSLKPTIYKHWLHTCLLEYVRYTYDFLQWHGDGRKQNVPIPMLIYTNGLYTAHTSAFRAHALYPCVLHSLTLQFLPSYKESVKMP